MKVRHMGQIFEVIGSRPGIVNGGRSLLIKNERFIKFAAVGKCQPVREGTDE